MKSIGENWQRLDQWLSQNVKGSEHLLNGPANRRQIEKLGRMCGVRMPKDFFEFYGVHDGQSGNIFGLINCHDMLPIAEVIEEWLCLYESSRDGDFEGSQSKSPKEVRTDWWNPGWIPFAQNGSGDFYCIDLAPTKLGNQGQIIQYWHDHDIRPVLGPSLAEWFHAYVDRVLSGEVIYHESLGALEDTLHG